MKLHTLAALVAAFALPGEARAHDSSPGATPPAHAAASIGWMAVHADAEDRADTLYREARAALNRNDYARAARLFRELWSSHPKSRHAPDAPYWEAFALYRTDDEGRFREALGVLATQRSRFPKAATLGEARTLEIRIRGKLAGRGDSESAEQVAEAAERTSEGCLDEDQDDRVAALNALLQMNAERAVPILRKVLARRDQCSETLRRKAVFLVAQKVTPETEDILLETLRTDPDVEVREQAVFWLSQVNTEKAVVALEQILRTSRDRNIQEKALFALSQHRSPRGATLLREYAQRDSVPNELREKAIFWIGQRRSADNAAFLRGLYARLRDEELKEKVLFSVSQMRGEGNEKWLTDIAADARESIEMRKKALFWAGQGGLGAAAIAAMYDRLADAEMKEQAIFVLSQKREAAAVDKLMAIAKTEKDRELRKKAVFWLSQSRDPRVADFLESLISQ